ncbi:hypothetical protein Y032_0090g2382 [Ancylostoma ceylanicum]|uniref:Proteasome activator Blm10 middle HEAT repeats region domain-containing protein n=1 Tax=Ancylostoma ceylanicum TaxID=53326 RepID=A0A016TNN4_9BILA|nr:hypothetical protein Y032_0090g2382 [Ancylostoma ceylanicum]
MKLAKKVLTFVKTNQFESQLATDMISSLISQMTYASPTFWLPFAEHVLRNLREVLAGDAKTAEDLETSAQWFVTLAGSLLSTTSENYIQYKDVCFEMIGLLVECKSKVAYNNGAIGLWYMLYMLSRVYPENSRYISARLNRPLSEWVPVREWATLHDLRESEMAWYVPGEKAKELVKSLLEKFVFPVVDSLQDAKMDRCNIPYSCLGQAKLDSCIIVLKILRASRKNKNLASVLQMQPPYLNLSSYMRTLLKVSD